MPSTSQNTNLNYYPFGSAIESRAFSSGEYRYGFNGMEKDSENNSGAYDFGSRIYDARLGKWVSLDPYWKQYPKLSSYCFVNNGPIYFIDVEGKYFVGTNGEKVTVKIESGKIVLGENATNDIITMANRINNSNSITAQNNFMKAADNPSRINLKLTSESKETALFGYHQPHSVDGELLEWVGGDGLNGYFDGMPAYITDEDGNIYYKYVTITIYEGEIASYIDDLRKAYNDPKLTCEEETVITLSHEIVHNIDQESIKVVKNRLEGNNDDELDVEEPAEKVENAVREEIKNNR